MTDADIRDFTSRLDRLYPEKLNDEQLAVWTAYVRKLPSHEAMSALNDYYAGPKKAADGPQPALNGFMRCIRERHKSKGQRASNRCHPNDPEWLHTQRHILMKNCPDKHGEYDSMPTAELELDYHHYIFRDALWAYGHAHPQSRHYFDKWQAKVALMGYPTISYEDACGSVQGVKA